jgi:Flp pilus assembly protein TadB
MCYRREKKSHFNGGKVVDLGIIIAISAAVVAIVGVMIALFLWNRGEANADRRHQDNENKILRRELIDVMRSIDREMKDFHGRLCTIEERRK